MNEFVTRTSLEEAAHSSGYAKAQSGSNFGSASSVSFEKRVNNNNSVIRKYQDSRLAQIRYAKYREVSKSANSSLEAIRARRAEILKDAGVQSPNRLGSQRNRNSYTRRDLSQVNQSGIARMHSNPVSTNNSSSRFFSIQPKIGR